MVALPALLFIGAGAALLLSSCSTCEDDTTSETPQTPPNPEPPTRQPQQAQYEMRINDEQVRRVYNEIRNMGADNAQIDRGMVLYFRGRPHFEEAGPDRTINAFEVMNAVYDWADAEPNDDSAQHLLQTIRNQPTLQRFITHGLTHSVGNPGTRNQRLQEGIQIMETLLRDEQIPESEIAGYYLGLGDAYWGLGDLENAEISFRHSIELNPQDFIPPYNLSYLLWEREQFEESIHWRTIGRELHGNLPEDDPEWIPNIFDFEWLNMVSQHVSRE